MSLNIQNEIIKKILASKDIPEWLERVSLNFPNKISIPPSAFERINALIVSKTLLDNTQDKLALMHPYGDATLHWIVLMAVLSIYEQDYSSPDANILSRLKRKELFLKDGELVRFEKYDQSKNEISFIEKKNCLTTMNASNLKGKIQLYHGTAKKEGVFSGRRALPPIQHSLFSAIYKVEATDMCSRASIVVVTQKKDYIDQVKKLIVRVSVDGKIIENHFCKAVPVVTQINPEITSKLLPIRDSRPPVLRIVSNLSVAMAVIKSDPNINTLIVDGETKFRNWELKELLEIPHLKNKILLFAAQMNYEVTNHVKNMAFLSWIWDLECVKKFCIQSSNPNMKEVFEKTDPFLFQEKLLTHAIRYKRQIIRIPYPDSKVKKNMKHLKQELLRIQKQIEDPVYGEKLCELVKRVYRFRYDIFSPFFNVLVRTPAQTESLYKADAETIGELCAGIKNSISDSAVKSTIEQIHHNVEALEITFSATANSKFRMLKACLADNDKKIIVVFKRARDVEKAKILYSDFTSKHQFISMSDLRNMPSCEHILFVGFFGAASHAQWLDKPISAVQTFLLYGAEEQMVIISDKNKFEASCAASPLSARAQLLGITLEECKELFELDKIRQALTERIDSEFEREEDLIDLEDKISMGGEIPITFSELDPAAQTEARYVDFEDDAFAYLTDNYKAKILDRSIGKIIVKNISDLVSGDELLFIKDTHKDVFDAIIEVADRQSVAIIEKINLWKDALKRFKTTNNLDEYQLLEIFGREGIHVGIHTVKSWFDEERIAPACLKELLVFLARELKEPALLEQSRSIVVACRKLRARHSFVGRLLAKQIIGAASGDDLTKSRNLGQDLMSGLRDLKNHVQTMQLIGISDQKKNVPRSMTNRLLEK